MEALDYDVEQGTATASAGRLEALLWCLVAGGIAARVWHFAACPSIWTDEAHLLLNITTYSAAELPFSQLAATSCTQAAPPLFLLLLKGLVSLAGRSDYAVRLPAFLAGLATLPLFAIFTRRVAGLATAVLATGMLAFSDNAITQCIHAKPYTIDLLATVVLMLLGLAWQAGRPPSRGKLAVFSLLATALPWASYGSILAVAFVSLVILVEIWPAGWRRRIELAAWMILPAVSFLLLNRLCIRVQRDDYLSDFWTDRFPPFARPANLPGWMWGQTYSLFRFACTPLGGALLPLSVVGAIAWYKTNRRLLLLVLGALGLSLLAAALRRYPYGGTRVNLYLIPAILLMSAAGMERIVRLVRDHRWRLGVAVLASAPLLSAIGMQGWRLTHTWDRGDVRAAIAHLEANRRPGEHVYLWGEVTSVDYFWYRPNPDPLTHTYYYPPEPIPQDGCWLIESYVATKKDIFIDEPAFPPEFEVEPTRSLRVRGGEALWLVRKPGPRPPEAAIDPLK